MTKKTSKSFCDIYEEKKSCPSPLQQFINEVAHVAGKSGPSIRRWATGAKPDTLTQRVLAEHFGTTPEKLFPNTKEDQQ